jgi:hypothetical protein
MALVATVGALVALVLALVGVGHAWLIVELAVVLGIVVLDLAAHLALLAGALWFATGPIARHTDRQASGDA